MIFVDGRFCYECLPMSLRIQPMIMKCSGCSHLFQENAITPSDGFLFPTTDWLIGNHSDELTPWIPVIAARQVINTEKVALVLRRHLLSSKFISSDWKLCSVFSGLDLGMRSLNNNNNNNRCEDFYRIDLWICFKMLVNI